MDLPVVVISCHMYRGQSIRVTLWGGLGDILIEKKSKYTGMCGVVVTSTSAKHYNSEWAWSIWFNHEMPIFTY